MALLTLEVSRKNAVETSSEDSRVSLRTRGSDYFAMKAEVAGMSQRLKDLERVISGKSARDMESNAEFSSLFSTSVPVAQKQERSVSPSAWIPAGKSISYKPSSPTKPPSTPEAHRTDIRRLVAHFEKLWQSDHNRITEVLEIMKTFNNRISRLETIVMENVEGSSSSTIFVPTSGETKTLQRPATSPIIKSELLNNKKKVFGRNKDDDHLHLFSSPLISSSIDARKPEEKQISPRTTKLQIMRFKETIEDIPDLDNIMEMKMTDAPGKVNTVVNHVAADSSSRVDEEVAELRGNTEQIRSKDQKLSELASEVNSTQQLLEIASTDKTVKKAKITDWITEFQKKYGKLPAVEDKVGIRDLYTDYKSVSLY